MHIKNITLYPVQNNYLQYHRQPEKNGSSQVSISLKTSEPQKEINYSQIAFGSIYNVKNVKVKKVDIDAEKAKLLKQISGMLDIDIEDTDIEDIITNSIRKALLSIRTKLIKQDKLLKQADELFENKTLNPMQKFERINQIRKEAKRLEKPIKTTTQKNKQTKTPDERIDYQLLNKFKTAIEEDNFNLKKIVQGYYSNLNTISTIEELNKKYPKIKTPKRPEQVIAEKIADTMTRDFYEEVDRLYENNAGQELETLIYHKIADVCNGLTLKYVDPETFCKKIINPTVQTICDRYVTAKTSTGFSSLPENRKMKTPQINDADMKLLAVDFDDFVLSTVRKHYLESQRLSDITYNSGNVKISLTELRSSDYKFEKMPEKIRSFIKTSDSLFAAQRNYDNYDINQLKTRLNYFANRELGNNEEILKNIIDFDACNFTDEDIKLLTRFLKELDSINDGEKTIDAGLAAIHYQGIRPKGTEKLNELEKQKAAETLKARQQEVFKLNELKTNFDNAINILYNNNLNNIANTCSKYRPKSLDAEEIKNAEILIKIINENINSETINKAKLEANISRWDTFNYYKKTDPTNPIITACENGSIDIDKAGQLIINTEIVNAYPGSLEFVHEPEVLTKIMEKTGNDTEAAIYYLTKFDDYKTLLPEEKSRLSVLLKMFDTKDNVDKTILKYIIENDYITSDTKVLTTIHNGTSDETIPAEILAPAKQQIYNKYKYPTCIQYMAAFEDALSSFARATGTSGIKMTGRNNKTIEYKMELKIKGYDDRLFSSRNDYRFDIFSDRGMH